MKLSPFFNTFASVNALASIGFRADKAWNGVTGCNARLLLSVNY